MFAEILPLDEFLAAKILIYHEGLAIDLAHMWWVLSILSANSWQYFAWDALVGKLTTFVY